MLIAFIDRCTVLFAPLRRRNGMMAKAGQSMGNHHFVLCSHLERGRSSPDGSNVCNDSRLFSTAPGYPPSVSSLRSYAQAPVKAAFSRSRRQCGRSILLRNDTKEPSLSVPPLDGLFDTRAIARLSDTIASESPCQRYNCGHSFFLIRRNGKSFQ